MKASLTRLRRLRRGASALNRPSGIDSQRGARRDSIKPADSVFARVAIFAEQDNASRKPKWRRFPAAAVASSAAMFLLLLGFAYVLRPRVRALPPTSAIVAKLIELARPKPEPPPKIAPSAPAHIAPQTRPKREVHHAALPKAKPRLPAPPPPILESAPGSRGSISVGGSREAKPPSPPAGTATGNSEGAGAGVGGCDSSGARAIYAPLPKIPDELRENAFSAVAVAHFVVGPDGTVQVTLTTPTQNPKLNELILETLHEWKFFPAIKDGVAIASQFDVRIPVSVQ